MKKHIPFLFLCIMFAVALSAQKVRKVIAKDGEVINVQVTNKQAATVQVNGKVIYQQKKPVIIPPAPRVLNFKDFSDWRVANNTAITEGVPLTGDTLVLDSDCIPSQHEPWQGDFIWQGTEAKASPAIAAKPLVVICNFRAGIDTYTYSLYTGAGNHTFKNVKFIKIGDNPFGGCIQTQEADITYNNRFINCTWEGSWYLNYQSTGGHGITTFDGCKMYAQNECIQYYCQMGSKEIEVLNTTLQCVTSHTFYIHPWASPRFVNVTVLGCGKLAGKLMSGSPENYPFVSKYCIFKNCKNADGIKSPMTNDAPMWQIWSQGATIELDNCNLPTYEWMGNFNITNSNITTGGNGTAIYGAANVNNCTGGITATRHGKLIINNSRMGVTGLEGSDILVTNSTINYGNNFNPESFKAVFKNCDLGDIDITAKRPDILFEKCRFNSQYRAIRLFGPVTAIDNIKFVGDRYPIATY